MIPSILSAFRCCSCRRPKPAAADHNEQQAAAVNNVAHNALPAVAAAIYTRTLNDLEGELKARLQEQTDFIKSNIWDFEGDAQRDKRVADRLKQDAF